MKLGNWDNFNNKSQKISEATGIYTWKLYSLNKLYISISRGDEYVSGAGIHKTEADSTKKKIPVKFKKSRW